MRAFTRDASSGVSAAARGTCAGVIMWANDKRKINVTRVLCPVDFSDCSRRALDCAVAITRWFGAEIEVLHVVPEPLVTGRAAIQTPLDMGVRGRGAIDRLLLGSVTDRIVRAAMRPVVTVRDKAERRGLMSDARRQLMSVQRRAADVTPILTGGDDDQATPDSRSHRLQR